MEKKIKIIYIISLIDKAYAFEWIAGFLNREIYSSSFILLNPVSSRLETFLQSINIPVTTIRFNGKKSYPMALIRLWWILIRQSPDIIHCHLFDATVIGLIAGTFAGVKRRIFTRHHSVIHHTTNPSGLKWDKLCNRLATDIIAISKSIQEILIHWDKAPAWKIILIHHGFDFSYFAGLKPERILILRSKYNIPDDQYPVIGVISRYTEWKGIQYVIPAFRKLIKEFPGAHLVLANAHGDYEVEIKKLLSELQQGSYTEVHFEEDLAALYRLFNIFIHVPVDSYSEAFGQTYIEALISGIPSVFTKSGIANELIRNRENAIVVEYKNSDQIFNAMLEIINNDFLQEKIIDEGKKSIQGFSIETHIRFLENLYLTGRNE